MDSNKLVSVPVVGRCVTRNGETDIGLMTSVVKDDGEVCIGFVSSKLHRALNAGAKMRASDLDLFCEEWLRSRGKSSEFDMSDMSDMSGESGEFRHALNDEAKSVTSVTSDTFDAFDAFDAFVPTSMDSISEHALNVLASGVDKNKAHELMVDAFKQASLWLTLVKLYMHV